MKFKTKEELLEYTSNIVGKTFEEIDSKHLLENTTLRRQKGLLGHVVETGFYNYPINNDSRADFEELDIELKVSGYIKNKNGTLRAKERLVLSKIDYNQIVNETFESSHVLGKCKNMLIIWYEYDTSKEVKDFLITNYQLYDMEKDKKIFKNDFEIIKGKVLDGKAHELSEGDTSYLGACTKARTSSDRTTQPFSDILPKPRAYSLKNAFMTGILRENFTTIKEFKTVNKNHELIKDNITELKTITPSKELINHLNTTTPPRRFPDKTSQSSLNISFKQDTEHLEDVFKSKISRESFETEVKLPVREFYTVEEYVRGKLSPYFGKTQLEILEEITDEKITGKIPKNLNKMISDRLIGKDEELPKKDELFRKTTYIIKNVPLTKNETLQERVSFRNLRLDEFNVNWEESEWKQLFEEQTFILICYKMDNKEKNGFRKIHSVKKITFSGEEIDLFEKTFNQVKLAIKNRDVKLLPTSNNGFKDYELQLAPKSKKNANAYDTFFEKNVTKTCFMINKKLINKKIKNN